MATYVLRGLDADTIAAAKQRALDAGQALDAVLRASLAAYAAGQASPGAQLGAIGGAARGAGMTAQERSAGARQAARARWKDRS